MTPCRAVVSCGCITPLQQGPSFLLSPVLPQMISASSQPRLMVLSGPSGVGKGTLVTLLRQRHPDLWLSVSATTRSPRPGEQQGVHYFFHSQESFQQLVAAGGLLEWASFAGNSYGTPRQPVEQQLAAGVPVLLEIELEGARQVRRSWPEAFQIFLRPPSLTELERRIRGSGLPWSWRPKRSLTRWWRTASWSRPWPSWSS